MECRLTTQAERNNAAVLAGQKDIMCKMDTMCLEAENKSLRERLARVEAESLASATANSTAARLENFVVKHYNPTVK